MKKGSKKIVRISIRNSIRTRAKKKVKINEHEHKKIRRALKVPRIRKRTS